MTTLRNGRVHLTCPACKESLATTQDHRVRFDGNIGITVTPRLCCPTCYLILEVTRGRTILHGRRASFPSNDRLIIGLQTMPPPTAIRVANTPPPEVAPPPAPEPEVEAEGEVDAKTPIHEYSYRDLQEECKNRGLSAHGKRRALIKRLTDEDE